MVEQLPEVFLPIKTNDVKSFIFIVSTQIEVRSFSET